MANPKTLKPGKNATSFSSTNQPDKRGRPKIKGIQKLMHTFGKGMAPADLLDNETVRHFLDEHGLKGTVNEVLVARLYAMALYGGDIKAVKLILDLLNNTKGAGHGGMVIQFITPPPISQEAPIDLSNDSWTVMDTAKEKSD